MYSMADPTIQTGVTLADYTTLHVGGPAEYFVVVVSEEALRDALVWANEHNQPVTVLAGGSNVLIADEGIRGLVIKNEIGGLAYEEKENGVTVIAGAGGSWDGLVAETVAHGLWGLENLSGIPGTVGGAVVQNINAYGVTIEEVIEYVETVHVSSGTLRVFQTNECNFAYRNSFFKQSGTAKEYIVTGVRMRLSRTPNVRATYKSASQSMQSYFARNRIADPAPSDVRAAVLEVRERIGMLEGMYKSAGSFFTNAIVTQQEFERIQTTVEAKYPEKSAQLSPWHWELADGRVKISAAFLMECTPFNKTDFAGKAFNDAVGISPVHTLSLINLGGANASDIRAFATEITDTVQTEFGITLESEVSFL